MAMKNERYSLVHGNFRLCAH